MARSSARRSTATAEPRSHKRRASATKFASTATKRAKRQSGTGTMSRRKKDSSEESPGTFSESPEEDTSDFENEIDESEATDDEEEVPSDNSEPERQATSRRKSKTTATSTRRQKRTDVPSGKSTSLAPGSRVVMRRPKARDPGDTPYLDETIHPNTLEFLRDLAANNSREWLKSNDPDYRTSQKDWSSFVEQLTHKIIEADPTIPELPVKDVIFRIHRDVRFSNDKTPYKTAFSVAFSRTGRKGPYGAYYIQIKPNGGSLVAGGIWMPEANDLALLRNDIDRRPDRIKQVLSDARLRKEFLGGVSKDPKKVVQRFVDANAEGALKTKPKGYEPDHRDINLLRLRSFTVHRKLEDEEVLGIDGRDRIAYLVSCLVPFVTYLNSVVRPDDDTDMTEEDDGSEGEGTDE